MPSWDTTGNATTPTDFLGTTNGQSLVIKTAGTEHVRIDPQGNVGIGTNDPTHPVHLAPGKGLRIDGGTNAGDALDYFSFGGNGSFGIDAPGVPDGRFVVQNSGNVGIGKAQPSARLDVAGDATVAGAYALNADHGQTPINYSLHFGFNPNAGDSVLQAVVSAPGALGPAVALMNPGGGVNAAAAIDFFTFDPGEGVGPDHETGPSSQIKATDVGNFGNDIVFLSNKPGAANNELVEQLRITSKGNITVPGDILLTGADCAEHFDALGDQSPEPGTVVVIDESGALRESLAPYDKKVAGVVSGPGDHRPALVLDKRSSTEARATLALVGKVYCKADAHYAPIEVGDLLTTSPTPGHAMKATDPLRAFGSVIGKALQPLQRGRGLIRILVALQ